eukprot:PhM_4_TR15175/c2_g4_i14/m.66957
MNKEEFEAQQVFFDEEESESSRLVWLSPFGQHSISSRNLRIESPRNVRSPLKQYLAFFWDTNPSIQRLTIHTSSQKQPFETLNDTDNEMSMEKVLTAMRAIPATRMWNCKSKSLKTEASPLADASQSVNYAHRGPHLRHMSLYEYVGCVIVQRENASKETP